MTKKIFALLAAGAALGGCTGPVIMGGDAAVIILTKPSSPPPADTQDQIAEHASWCYQTMADIQCFSHPQNVAPDRLVNVDPQSLYPLDVPAYHQALFAKTVYPPAPLAVNPPMDLQPDVDVQVEKETLRNEVNPGIPPSPDAPQLP